ncbi:MULTISPECIES: hypothetical protein [Nosocomiicoccus]|nr:MULTISPECIES: hypothetical protein [Nosocomiicoccus]MDK6863187.1 hypothetical protein [Nosocomiicoccus ampullae]
MFDEIKKTILNLVASENITIYRISKDTGISVGGFKNIKKYMGRGKI